MCHSRATLLEVHRILEEELQNHAQIFLHHGKTQVWNRAGVPLRGIDILTRVARRVNPKAIVWRGARFCQEVSKGSKSSGFQLVSQSLCTISWNGKTEEHSVLFQRIPAVEDPQAAWLLIASTRANYWLRSVRLDLTDTQRLGAKTAEGSGGFRGQRVGGVEASSEEGENWAQELPINVQITQCKEFAQRETPCQDRGGTHRRNEVVGRRSRTVVSSGTVLFLSETLPMTMVTRHGG